MRIAIIGGLGYLGFSVFTKLCGTHDVSVIDTNLYGKWTDDEIKKVIPEEDFLKEDVRKVDAGYWNQHFDKVIICSDIDVEEFYTSRHLDDYRKHYRAIIQALQDLDCDVYYVYSLTGDQQEKFVDKILDHDSDTFHTIQCPVLYGTARGFRSDTIINQAVLHFTVNKEYTLIEDPFKVVAFANVWNFAESVANYVVEDNVQPTLESKLPLIMICNLIQWMFGVEYRLAVGADISESNQVPHQEIYFDDKDGLTLFINEIKQGMERGFAEELLQEKYDNALCVQEMVAGMKYGDMLK